VPPDPDPPEPAPLPLGPPVPLPPSPAPAAEEPVGAVPCPGSMEGTIDGIGSGGRTSGGGTTTSLAADGDGDAGSGARIEACSAGAGSSKVGRGGSTSVGSGGGRMWIGDASLCSSGAANRWPIPLIRAQSKKTWMAMTPRAASIRGAGAREASNIVTAALPGSSCRRAPRGRDTSPCLNSTG
jgi:hypothetical protein